MAVRKKQDDKYLLALRELVNSGAGNRQCFDCNQKGPTYVNMTIGSFVCTRCSGVLRGLTPPHRVKSISMATFTQDELDFLKAHGNELCAKTWLGLWDPKRAAAQQQDQRELMIDKYERKRYYLEPASPLKSLNLKTSSNGYHSHNSNNNNNNNNNSNISSNGYASIHLTPPAAQRTAANGLSKTTSSSASTTAISRPQHHHHHNHNHNQSQLSSSNGNGHDAFNLGLGLTSLNSAGSTSTGALSDTSSCASNGFAGDTDFVADFGTANIFDATSARSTGSPAVSSASSVSSTNGYAKVQPIRAAHLQQQQQQQQQQQLQQHHMLNGNNSENFADFDHAPIYNAGGASLQSSQLGQQQQQQKRSPRAGGNAPSEDRYAALKDLDEQLRELKASEASVTEAPTPTNANNNAALDAFGTAAANHNNNNNNNNANPFKSQQALHINGNGNSSTHVVNPFQAQQLQQQLQLQQQNLYGQLTLIPNGYGSSPQQTTGVGGGGMLQQPQASSSFYNFNNNGYALNQGLPNGCGFGSMQPAPVLAGGLAGGFNNPFAASGAMNTNNPFL